MDDMFGRDYGIFSARELFKRRMKYIIEGLEEEEVISGNFLIIVYRENDLEAASNHDNNLNAFQKNSRKNKLKLNCDEIKWK